MKALISFSIIFLFTIEISKAQFKMEIFSYSITKWVNGSVKNGNIVFKATCEKDTSIMVYFATTEEYNDFKFFNYLPNRKLSNSFNVELVNTTFDTLSGGIAYHYAGPIKKRKVNLKKGQVYYLQSNFEFWYETKFVEFKEIIVDYYEFATIMDRNPFNIQKSKRTIIKL